MTERNSHDPYALHPEGVASAPQAFREVIRWLGPGLITASAVVGTGELIAAPVLGAESGYDLLWLILLSCVLKVVIQHELGRYSIGTGDTGLEALDRVPGPHLRVHWVVWCWFVMQTMSLMAQGGMFAGVAEILHRLVPAVGISTWVWGVMAVTVFMLVVGRYQLIERVSVCLVICFTALTVSAAGLLLMKPEYFSWSDLLDGLMIRPPQGGLGTAVAAFGITGVGSADLVTYCYWSIEKGYARYTGACDNTPAWLGRARGWLRVMSVDVLSAMVVYTCATVAFYLLGAGILHGLGVLPQGTETVEMLSNIYTETLGSGSHYFFLAGAFAVLYSSLFAGTAAAARVFADFVALMGGYQRRDYKARRHVTQIFSFILLFVPAVYYMLLREPILMVKIAGYAQAIMLPILAFSTIYLRYFHLPRAIRPRGWITLALWVVSLLLLFMLVYTLLSQLA